MAPGPHLRRRLVVSIALILCAWTPPARTQEDDGLSDGAAVDRTALLALKAAMSPVGFGKSKVKASWKPDTHPCLGTKVWAHIKCAGDRVIKLNLADKDIKAQLPEILDTMDRLQELDLSGNSFTGTIHPGWGKPASASNPSASFKRLQKLLLSDNQLEGPLPNKDWNARGAWPALTVLDLSNNYLFGGLPEGWFSTNQVFVKKVRLIDLSHNYLGYSDSEGEAQLGGTPAWCVSSETTGWCATRPPAKAEKLATLRLAYNGLKGQLPAVWARFFTGLKTLELQGNQLYTNAGLTPLPSPLPKAWTMDSIPEPFEFLLSLVLYPGNDYICSLPDFADGGSSRMDINLDQSFPVEDEEGVEYGADEPKDCPQPADDNPPALQDFVVDKGSNTARLSWKPPTVDPNLVYGYRVTLYKYDPAVEDWVDVRGWAGKLFRTFLGEDYPTLQPGLAADASGAITLDTKFIDTSGTSTYRAEMVSFNVDGSFSSLQKLQKKLYFIRTAPECRTKPSVCELRCNGQECEYIIKPDSDTPPPYQPPLPEDCKQDEFGCVLVCDREATACEWVQAVGEKTRPPPPPPMRTRAGRGVRRLPWSRLLLGEEAEE